MSEEAVALAENPRTRVTFTYVNYRGEKSVRLVTPYRIQFGSNEWHREAQWLLDGHDHEKNAARTFAMKDISDWSPA